jgi:cyclic beta-1,2-glucan synthetase
MSKTPTPIPVFGEPEEPIRAELFGSERLEQHAESLAAAQTITSSAEGGRPLLPRVLENGRVLVEYYRSTAEAIQQDQVITPASEWLVDNFYIVEEQLREIRDDLPPGFYKKLPKLAEGHLEGYPRVFGVAWAYVAHTDSRFDPELLRTFVNAYQRVQPLTIGELWAVAITLRVVLVENLRRIAERLVRNRYARQEADVLADKVLGVGGQTQIPTETLLKEYGDRKVERAFAVQLFQRLRDLDPRVGPILVWLDKRLADQGTNADEAVRAEHQAQAATTVTVRNIMTSMRLMTAFDWQTFFESVSLVDEILRTGSNFGEMDFATRDYYRHAIEDLSRGSKFSETEVAQRAVNRARNAQNRRGPNNEPPDSRTADPGYYLISQGRMEFEQELGFTIPFRRSLLRLYVRAAVPGYLGTILLLTAVILALPLLHAAEQGINRWLLVLMAVLAAIPASDLAISLINRAVTDLLGPRTLPRLELKDGVPDSLRTLVAVPTLLTSEASIQEQVDHLEIHYLANPDGDLRFALLSDWLDGKEERMPGDEELLATATEAIDKLNEQHGEAHGGGPRFFLLHRKRTWNDQEKVWMGWERKRGKLHELNQLLRGATDTNFLPIAGKVPQLPLDIKYVITLDADTRLPRGAADKLVGTMAHPLNLPKYSAEQGRIVDGYAVVQPRITPTLPTDRDGSIFQRMFSGPAGIDPYASAVSDVYQDLFREGSYTGKGIYDIDAFETALAGKVRENTLLSHDLFEGIFARAALASDVELFDEYPSHYEVAASRQHRWTRGDWQLLPWIFGKGGLPKEQARNVHIPAISRWKMFDNLRRSLSAPAMLLTMLAGWLIPQLSPWVWTRFILTTISIPALISFLVGLNPRLGGISKRSHIRNVLSDLYTGLTQIAITVTMLAFQAWLMTDAILRTLGRIWITHRNLLQWTTAAQAASRADLRLLGIYRRMISSVVIALAVFIAVMRLRPAALPVAVPFVILWLAAPAVARWISEPPSVPDVEPLVEADAKVLRQIARATWRYFQTFVTAEHNFLPPDNFQEDPKPVVAHRTSTTNIGLYMVACFSARDLGWSGAFEVADRLDLVFATLAKLEMFRGHFYNWYDTKDLRPLDPKYVSTVDSGNLAGNLIVVATGARELTRMPWDGKCMLEGLEDEVHLAREAMSRVNDAKRTHTVTRKQISNAIDAFAASLSPIPQSPAEWSERFVILRERLQTLADMGQTLSQESKESADAELSVWTGAAKACVDSHARDARIAIPWLRFDAAEIQSHLARRARNTVEWVALDPFFQTLPSPEEATERYDAAIRALTDLRESSAKDGASSADAQLLPSIESLLAAIQESSNEAASLVRRLNSIAHQSKSMFDAMDFSFLYDPNQKLFSIGFRATDGTLDSNYYDLLASEARLTSFIAIAKGDVPPAHWFKLGRALTPVGRGSALISWSGSMFEYLMPALLMRSPSSSMLGQTYEQVVARQIEYGNERGVPWGISESAYNARDIDFTYQYSAFGVPGLGLKRGLIEDLVIAPYATALATMIEPASAVQNFARLAGAGGRGVYGFYESLDYTSSRLPEGKSVAVVKCYMAHHQGMSVVACANVLTDGLTQKRFHAEPIIQATSLLLQERTPRDTLVARPRAEEVSAAAKVRSYVPPVVRRFTNVNDPTPRTQLLSNGRYSVMLTSAGSGYSRWHDIAVTRWREDATRDNWGQYVFLRDEQTGAVWSAGYQPTVAEPDSYEATFFEDHAEIIRRDRSITTALEVLVSPEDDAEVRRISISNLGVRSRDIQVTSYAEISLTSHAADVSHPAFANLFVETEFVPQVSALVATRRKRSDDEASVWAAHVMTVDGETVGDLQYETDRAAFVGRARTLLDPISVIDGRPLSGTVGPVLDPLFSLRRTVRVPPGFTVHIVISTIVASSREDVLELTDKYRDARTFERTSTLAWTQAQVQMHHLGITAEEAAVFQRLANAMLYPDPLLRPSSEALAGTNLEINTLWSQGISGDLPIVLARIDDPDDVDLIRQLLRAHEYWRMKQMPADVVIINEKAPSYLQELQGSLEALIRSSQMRQAPDSHINYGKVFLLRDSNLPPQARAQLQVVARVVLLSRRGTLAEQVLRTQAVEPSPTYQAKPVRAGKRQDLQLPLPFLQFPNGLGGFAEDGREYVTILSEGLRTPEPWVNIVANPNFGFLVSESGAGFTWSENSHENQLTPWSNDHVFDTPGESFYIRDEISGEIWTPTALPIRDEAATYIARHGQGYSRFQHASRGIVCDLLQFVPPEDSIKIFRLTLQNESGRTRRLSVTAYAEWILGSSRKASAPYLITEIDSQSRALFVRSAWAGEFGGRVAFADLNGKQTSFTADRCEFFGRNGSPQHPAALEAGAALTGKVGAGLDPCAALQNSFELRPGARMEVVFFLGQGRDRDQARQLVSKYRGSDLDALFRTVTKNWDDILCGVQVKTPDPSMDVLLNRWLLYQTLSCRIWARAGFYQLSGAFGFRDQLQDVMALSIAKRSVTRGQILLAAAHQFVQGDVQHWWHPPSGRGIRTRMSDDLLWLPYVVTQYVEATGDTSILDEVVPFLDGDQLQENQKEAYFQPRISEVKATIFEHCARAIDISQKVGSHGLPLMGTGDWNDGMNRVGQDGKGESVWLGWFLHTVMWEFAKIADARGEHVRAEAWRIHVSAIKAALEHEGWDGEWYRRAYFDNGAPLGTAQDTECRIDAIAQSWGVISGAAEKGRATRAMAAVDQQLVKRPEGLILLLTPPFDHPVNDPGYIKGYLPGIRENGGQYTHASTWTLIAFAALGDGDKAGELFRMMNPINRANSRASAQRYKVEPYALAGDIYAEPPHVGRGGWTWYTGSAGWLYRSGIEWILGFRVRGSHLAIDPCIPAGWREYSLEFRYHSATYKIRVENPNGVSKGVRLTELDGKTLAGSAEIPLLDDSKTHSIRIVLG